VASKMIGGSFLSLLPQGLFKFVVDEAFCGMVPNSGDDKVRKRRREDGGGRRTPNLVLSPTGVFSCGSVREHDNSDGGDRPTKRLRGERNTDEDLHLSSSSSQLSSNGKISVTCDRLTQKKQGHKTKNQTSDLIDKLPADIVGVCLSFVGSTEDRYALQHTCKLFRDVSNSESMLKQVEIVGNLDTGEAGIIQEHDTPASASAALVPFARAGNLQALYMLGIVKCYCYQDLKNGIHMLTMASSRGYLRSSYTLGIILRDALVDEASQYMNIAASEGYLPALQEVLPAREMKERFGEPNADELRRHLDPVGLNRLLLRDYVNSAELRGMNTSHCWNPLCGKWAYKASSNTANNSSNPNLRMRRSSSSAVIQPTYDVDKNMLDSSPSNNINENEGTIFPQRGEEIGVTLGTVNNNNSIGFNNRLHRRRHNHSFNPIAAVGGHGLSLPTSFVQSQSWFSSNGNEVDRVARMKMCSRCCRAKYCSKLCQVYDWRSSQHKNECQYLSPH